MSRLPISKRCKLFEKIAEDVWSHLIYNHAADTEVSEIGITNDIIAEIRNNKKAYPNIGVWARRGVEESEYGNDIDIFIEKPIGKFIWYAFQAKVLKSDGKYKDVKTLRGDEYQWDKLKRLRNNSGSVVRYLLYNGIADYSFSGTDHCDRPFDEKQFGCSIMNLIDVEKISLTKTPSFHDLHPQYAQPWRVIVCCWHYPPREEQLIYYSLSQIKNAIKFYPESFGNVDLLNEDEYDKEIKPVNDFPTNAIVNFSEQAERTPDYRIVIRNTASIIQDRK